MPNRIARCGCNCITFIIHEEKVVCADCEKEYPFNFIVEGVCETKANDLVIHINEGY